MKHSRSTRGFTSIELMLVMFIATAVWMATLSIFETTDSMVQDARVRTRAESQHRRDLMALTNFLREVDIDTLSGFNAEGVATSPTCARVTGADLYDRTFGPTATLRWVEYAEEVDGIGRAGAIRVVSATDSEIICERVPQGGFAIEQQGRNLVLNLTTFWRTGAGRTITVSGSTVVAMRNVE